MNLTSGLTASLFSPLAYSVAAVTVANGDDNLSIYVLLFASSTPDELALNTPR
ncbi:MAG: hypothetical protein KME29_21310 [Calothrix sp. FI2-JRJ7]|nr:hypothetical protein [Calothrix sp. FI2-JRJ7]